MATTTKPKDAPAAEPQQAKPEPRIVSVTKPCPFRAKTARAAWYALAEQYEGKPVAEFIAAAVANPPSYHVRGKNAGQPEDPVEWVVWMASDKVKAITLG